MAIAIEAAYVLAELSSDRSMLVSAIRRLLDRHPGLGVMWTIAARIAGSVFPEDETWEVVSELSESWEVTSPRGIYPCSAMLSSAGELSLVDEDGFSMEIPFDEGELQAFLKSTRAPRIFIESDLVTSQFFLVHPAIEEFMLDAVEGKHREAIVLLPSALSVVSAVIKDSLCMRLRQVGPGRRQSSLVEMQSRFTVHYSGSEFAPSLLDNLTSWRVPQEILHGAGPTLG